MRWVHRKEDSSHWEAWQLFPDGGEEHIPVDRLGVALYLIHFQMKHPNEWTVTIPDVTGNCDHKRVGQLPLDMPQEQLFATAIAMWRMK